MRIGLIQVEGKWPNLALTVAIEDRKSVRISVKSEILQFYYIVPRSGGTYFLVKEGIPSGI